MPQTIVARVENCGCCGSLSCDWELGPYGNQFDAQTVLANQVIDCFAWFGYMGDSGGVTGTKAVPLVFNASSAWSEPAPGTGFAIRFVLEIPGGTQFTISFSLSGYNPNGGVDVTGLVPDSIVGTSDNATYTFTAPTGGCYGVELTGSSTGFMGGIPSVSGTFTITPVAPGTFEIASLIGATWDDGVDSGIELCV